MAPHDDDDDDASNNASNSDDDASDDDDDASDDDASDDASDDADVGEVRARYTRGRGAASRRDTAAALDLDVDYDDDVEHDERVRLVFMFVSECANEKMNWQSYLHHASALHTNRHQPTLSPHVLELRACANAAHVPPHAHQYTRGRAHYLITDAAEHVDGRADYPPRTKPFAIDEWARSTTAAARVVRDSDVVVLGDPDMLWLSSPAVLYRDLRTHPHLLFGMAHTWMYENWLGKLCDGQRRGVRGFDTTPLPAELCPDDASDVPPRMRALTHMGVPYVTSGGALRALAPLYRRYMDLIDACCASDDFWGVGHGAFWISEQYAFALAAYTATLHRTQPLQPMLRYDLTYAHADEMHAPIFPMSFHYTFPKPVPPTNARERLWGKQDPLLFDRDFFRCFDAAGDGGAGSVTALWNNEADFARANQAVTDGSLLIMHINRYLIEYHEKFCRSTAARTGVAPRLMAIDRRNTLVPLDTNVRAVGAIEWEFADIDGGRKCASRRGREMGEQDKRWMQLCLTRNGRRDPQVWRAADSDLVHTERLADRPERCPDASPDGQPLAFGKPEQAEPASFNRRAA